MGQSEQQLRILIADDVKDVLQATKLLLKQKSQLVDTLSDPKQIPQYFEKTQYDVVLQDMNFNNVAGSGDKGKWLDWRKGRRQQSNRATEQVFLLQYISTLIHKHFSTDILISDF